MHLTLGMLLTEHLNTATSATWQILCAGRDMCSRAKVSMEVGVSAHAVKVIRGQQQYWRITTRGPFLGSCLSLTS